MDITLEAANLQQFRYALYQNFNKRADTLLELLDALCSQPETRSVVEYSLAPCYRRSYSTIFKALDELRLSPLWLPLRLAPYLPRPTQRPFWLLIADVTVCPRPYVVTLEDRGMAYQPEVVKGELPVTIGHQYSTVVLGLEPEAGCSVSWMVSLLTERVPTTANKELVGARQIGRLLQAPELTGTLDRRRGRKIHVAFGEDAISQSQSLGRNLCKHVHNWAA